MRTLDRKSDKEKQPNFDPIITQAKFDELQGKLTVLQKKRPQLADEVARLAELGDFSENVEYQLAKGRLRGLNYNILKFENQLRQAVIIPAPTSSDVVQIGSTVTVSNGKKEETYQILGSAEADPSQGIISHISPIGAALLGHRVGDVVEVSLAIKKIRYTILRLGRKGTFIER